MKTGRKNKVYLTGVLAISLLFFTYFPQTVYAGSINGNESQVIGAMSGIFESGGKEYQVSPDLIGEVRSYLSRDDVDLTSEQAQAAVNYGFGNIEQGIADGYLMLIEEKQKTEESTQTEENAQTEESTQAEESTQKEKESKNRKNKQKKDAKKPDINTTVEDQTNKKPEKQENSNIKVENNIEQAAIEVENSKGESVLKVNTVIKNTGFSMKNSIITGGILMLILGITLIGAIRSRSFAYEDE